MAERSPGLWDDAAPDGRGSESGESGESVESVEPDVADPDSRDDDSRSEDARDAAHEAALGVAARHALHDEELIAAFAGGDLEAGPEADRAQALIARCAACRDLHRDISAIETAIRAAGSAADVAVLRSAPRDFRLTLEVATSLRPGAWLRPAAATKRAGSLLDRLVGAIGAFGRPVGASFAALGIVGLLVGSVGFGPGSLGDTAAGPEPGATAETTIIAGAASGDPTSSLRASASQPSQTDSGYEVNPPSGPIDIGSGSAAPWIVAGSAIVLALGLMLFVLGTRDRSGRESAGG